MCAKRQNGLQGGDMESKFEVVVDVVNSSKSARVFRQPDREFPKGRTYALRLDRVDGGRVREGDRLAVTIVASDPDRITHALVLRQSGAHMPHFAHA